MRRAIPALRAPAAKHMPYHGEGLRPIGTPVWTKHSGRLHLLGSLNPQPKLSTSALAGCGAPGCLRSPRRGLACPRAGTAAVQDRRARRTRWVQLVTLLGQIEWRLQWRTRFGAVTTSCIYARRSTAPAEAVPEAGARH